jgi:CBS domain containing-hemolysin-like protein
MEDILTEIVGDIRETEKPGPVPRQVATALAIRSDDGMSRERRLRVR